MDCFWVSSRTDITEPNGDNCLTCSMHYSWNSAGTINWYNDCNFPPDCTSGCCYRSNRFICDVGDKYV